MQTSWYMVLHLFGEVIYQDISCEGAFSCPWALCLVTGLVPAVNNSRSMSGTPHPARLGRPCPRLRNPGSTKPVKPCTRDKTLTRAARQRHHHDHEAIKESRLGPEASKRTRVWKKQLPKADWYPPAGSWENVHYTIDAVEYDASGKLVAYITWPNGQKIKLGTAVLGRKSPQKVMVVRAKRFYC